LFRPFVSHYTTVSRDLAGYLVERVGVSPDRVSQIYNGVDTELFKPRCGQRELPFHLERSEREPVLIGTVGRLQPVKDQALLLKAFAEAMRCAPDAMRSAYLVIVGDGPMRTVIEEEVRRLNLGNRAFLLGSRDDVASILRSLDLFVLPSLAEGISNTILEAMASGLPVLATRVGGNPELIVDGEVGALFEAGDWRALARLLVGYTADMALRNCQGSAARQRAERCFSLTAMVQSYLQLYDKLLAGCSSNARSS
jgi:sugar transferase (PEP-CTERM/EpsH1 system associated)